MERRLQEQWHKVPLNFLSCIQEICLDLYKFIGFETFVGDMICCESFDHLLLTHVCQDFLSAWKSCAKIFFHEKQSCERRRPKCISWIALLMQYKIEIKVESKTLALFYIFSYGEGLWIRRWKGASPPSPCIWNLAINHQPKLIHSFIHPFHQNLLQFLVQTFPMCLCNSKFKFAF